ncbi:protein of unknown function [Streptomyces sp. KY75]|nr:protein of unknown function [Streptomyces sp. KY75]
MPTQLDFAPVGRHMLTPPDQHIRRPPAGTAIPIEGLATKEAIPSRWIPRRILRSRAPSQSFPAGSRPVA